MNCGERGGWETAWEAAQRAMGVMMENGKERKWGEGSDRGRFRKWGHLHKGQPSRVKCDARILGLNNTRRMENYRGWNRFGVGKMKSSRIMMNSNDNNSYN